NLIVTVGALAFYTLIGRKEVSFKDYNSFSLRVQDHVGKLFLVPSLLDTTKQWYCIPLPGILYWNRAGYGYHSMRKRFRHIHNVLRLIQDGKTEDLGSILADRESLS